MSNPVFIEKLHLRNFRSIRSETISFDNPLFLVGRNASGKSNLVDAFAFLADCMRLPLSSVVSRRGDVVYSLGMEVSQVALRVDFRFHGAHEQHGHYALLLSNSWGVSLEVVRERCVVTTANGEQSWFNRDEDGFHSSVSGLRPAFDPEALALPIMGGVQEFAPVLKAFAGMRVYAIEPDRLREARETSGGPYLENNGANIVGVLKRTDDQDGRALNRICELLGPVVPNIVRIMLVEPHQVPNAPNIPGLIFFQGDKEDQERTLWASQMSDGTLRALGLIVAAMQDPAPSLIAIEEPEASIHPGALGVISDLIEMAAERTQVVITTHSPELLDAKWIQPENLRVVTWEDDATRVAELGIVPKRALQEHLMRAGQLLRANALDAAPLPERDEESAADLFDKVPA